MHALLLAWKNALHTLSPHRLLGMTISSFKSFGKGAYAFGRSFWWLFVADVVLFIVLGSYTTSPEALLAIGKSHSLLLIIILFIQSMIWFLASTFFFLLMHREEASDDYVYCAINVLKYCQITMLPPLALVMALYILITAGGITVLPSIPWFATICLRALSLMVIFYWLDIAIPSLNSFFSAIERGVNLCIYNLPLIAIFIGIALLINLGGSMLIAYVFNQPTPQILLGNITTTLSTHTATLKGRCLILCFKYGIFIVESIWTAFMLSIYRRKRNEEYTTMFFS